MLVSNIMKITLDTGFIKDGTKTDSISVTLDHDQIVTIEKTQGIDAANAAIDKFLHKYTNDIKTKLVSVFNK